uniref:C2H2-type domain-containing protein n=1 Tax=Glossina austeni TaxID=7395 RepID=A0A1A9UWL1_GLOAU
MVNFTCDFCGRTYKQKCSLNRHLRRHHQFNCLTWEVKFSSLKDFVKHQHLGNHIRRKENKDVYCDKCEILVMREMWPYRLRTNFHKDNWNKWMDMSITCVESTFHNHFETYKWENRNKENLILEDFLTTIENNSSAFKNSCKRIFYNIGVWEICSIRCVSRALELKAIALV